MINKYEAYWRWKKSSNNTYFFDCCTGPYIYCSDCPFSDISSRCADITHLVPTWNNVQKLMQEVYSRD